ncbi:hypothetical protein [Maribacter sp. 2210JD10-5]|uniref:hypothetical protein n=1 Tax=Maribacter sp. 2210JD10-5 TaxID=3386272 RepID=UPI0039BCE280
MKIAFRTKDEANMERERHFLALSRSERFYRFIEFMQHSKRAAHKSKKTGQEQFQDHDQNVLLMQQWKKDVDQFLELAVSMVYEC